MPIQSKMGALCIPLAFCASAGAQERSPGKPELLAKSFVEAVNSHVLAQRVAILHPSSKACINAGTEPYFSWIFSRQMKYVIPPAAYRVSIQQLPASWADGNLGYPLRPTHQIQIDFDTAPNRSTSVVLAAVRDGERWYEVLPCPGPEAIAGAQRSTAELQRQDEAARKAVAEIAAPLRSEILTLVKNGQRVEAIRKAAKATGNDLAIARLVVDLLTSTPAN